MVTNLRNATHLIHLVHFVSYSQAVADELWVLKTKLDEGEFGALPEIRKTVLKLAAPPQLVWLSLRATDAYMIFS